MIFIVSIIIIVGVFLFYRVTSPEISRRKQYLLSSLRITYLIIIAFLLFNPILRYFHTKMIKPSIVLLIDDSESMENKFNETTKIKRMEQLSDILEKKGNNKNYDVHKLYLSQYNKKQKSNTLLLPFYDYLKNEKRINEIQGIYLLSDGWIHDENLSFIQMSQIPVHSFLYETEKTESDLSIVNLVYNKTAFLHEKNIIKVRVNSTGYTGKCNIQLLIDQKEESSKEINVKENQFTDIEFETEFKKTGILPFEVRIINKDSVPQNNSFPGAVQVLNSKQKILIITDQLTPDLRFINLVIQQNSRFQSDLVINKNGQFSKKNQNINIAWNEYSAVFIINKGNVVITTTQSDPIEKLLQNGGGLVVFGYPVKGLEDFMPGTLANIQGQFQATFLLTKEAQQYSTFQIDIKDISNIPPINYFYVTNKKTAHVLAKVDNEAQSPFILHQNYGLGNIIYFAGFDLWKWKSYLQNKSYDEFIDNLCNWVSHKNSDRFYAYTSKTNYFSQEEIKIMLNAYDEKLNPMNQITPKIKVYQAKKLITEDYMTKTNNDFIFQIRSLNSGKYDFVVSEEGKRLETRGSFLIHSKSLEDFDKGFNYPLLSWISSVNKGKIIKATDIGNYEMPQVPPKTQKTTVEAPIYKKWYLISLFLFCVSTEYYLRKKWGLL